MKNVTRPSFQHIFRRVGISSLMQNSAQNPSAGNLGQTDWTLIGSECDAVSYYKTSTWMDGSKKVLFRQSNTTAPCYDHEGPLQDESDATNAVVSWSNGTPRDTANWTNWSQAPHSLHYMM